MQNWKIFRVMILLVSLLVCMNLCIGTAVASETTETMPAFALTFDSEEGVQTFSAFCVRSGEGVYLLSSAEAGAVAQTGCDAILVGVDFTQEAQLLKTVGQISYFRAEGLENVSAYELGAEFPDTVVYATILEENEERYCYISDPLVMTEGWLDYGSYYLSETSAVEDTYLLGAAILTPDGNQVVGMLSRNAEQTLAILPLLNNVFPADATVTSAPGAAGAAPTEGTESQETQPEETGEAEATGETGEAEPSGDKKTISGKVLLIIAGVLLLGGIIIAANKKPSGRKAPEQNEIPRSSNEIPRQGTIPLVRNEMVSDLVDMVPTAAASHRAAPAEAKWQLRCVRGPLEGKVYPLVGKLSIGRMQDNDVVFPENTKGVSGRHCEVQVSGGRVILQDLNATYGTYFGMEQKAKLKPNMDYTLQIGDVFILAEGGPAFRLESIGGSVVRTSFTVRSASGTLYRANGDGEITFGRNSECVAAFDQNNTAISGKHCKLFKKEDGLYLMDQGSTNGTFFGENQRLKPNVSYKVAKGTKFYLVNSQNAFVITEE